MNINQRAYRGFLSIIAPKGETSNRSLFFLFKAAGIAILIVFVINLFSIGKSTFGEWGDFFGGVLNPILMFLTFMGLIITIVIQQSELRESRVEFKRSADALVEQGRNTRKQSFEATFFQMLTIHNDIVNSIDLRKDDGAITQGRDCFNVFYTRLNKQYRRDLDKYMGGGQSDDVALNHAYETFWKTHQTELGHYYRYLYNVVRFVAESEYVEGPYIRLIRAQLSDQELLMLFYNCTSAHGEGFKRYIEEFALLDNMPKIRLLDNKHANMIGLSAYGQ